MKGNERKQKTDVHLHYNTMAGKYTFDKNTAIDSPSIHYSIQSPNFNLSLALSIPKNSLPSVLFNRYVNPSLSLSLSSILKWATQGREVASDKNIKWAINCGHRSWPYRHNRRFRIFNYLSESMNWSKVAGYEQLFYDLGGMEEAMKERECLLRIEFLTHFE